MVSFKFYYSLPFLRELAFSGPPLQVWRERSLRAFIREISNLGLKNARVLDAGCGAGFLSKKIGLYFPHFEITGVDISEPLVRWARSRNNLPNVRFVSQDFLKVEGEYDLIVSMEVLPVVGSRMQEVFVGKMASLLKGGGYAILTHLRPSVYSELYRKYWKVLKIGEIHAIEPTDFLKMVEIYDFSGYYYALDYLEGKYMVVMRRGGRVD